MISILVFAVQSLALAENPPPIADAGPDRNAYTGQTITLQGSAYDPDGEPIVYWAWTTEQMPPNGERTLDSANTPNPLFTGFVAGDYVLALTVGDASEASLPDLVTIHVRDNIPPVAVATADRTTITIWEQVCF